MNIFTMSKKNTICLVLVILSFLFLIIGSADGSAGYFVVTALLIFSSIGVFFSSEKCIKNMLSKNTDIDTVKEIKNTPTEDPVNGKKTVSEPPVIKLSEVVVR